ncbi:MAG: hypothetical protein LUE17_17520 [Planctomycetaceae bacterium]|nr:hypothetical protein [Planctomycetaceae bacterium]
MANNQQNRPPQGRRAEEQPASVGTENGLVDVNEAARLCMISASMFYKLNAAGKTPLPVHLGKLLRWRKIELLDWIAAGCPGRKKTAGNRRPGSGTQ